MYDWQPHHGALNLYADDKQIYADAPLSGINDVRNHLHVCTDDVRCWCASRRLQLNDGKTELAWFGKRSRLRRLADLHRDRRHQHHPAKGRRAGPWRYARLRIEHDAAYRQVDMLRHYTVSNLVLQF